MTPTHATKKAKRYRYYVSASLLAGDRPQAQKGMHVPAGDIEGLVLDRLRAFLSSRIEVSDALASLDLEACVLDVALRNASKLSERWNKTDQNDAEGLAQIVRTGWYGAVHVKSFDSHCARALLGARTQLVGMTTRLSNHIRGVLKTFGALVLDITYIIVFLGSLFSHEFAGLPVSCSKRFVAETVSRAISAAAVMKISPAPFRG